MVDGLGLKHLGQLFVGVLKARLILQGYTVAVPEPDTGEDLWFATSVEKSDATPELAIYRAQCKSARKKQGRYETNDYLRTLDYAQSQSRFVYFYGLYDARLGSNIGDQFHIGCVPAQYWHHVRVLDPDAGANKGSIGN
jgi:hypothetical protein